MMTTMNEHSAPEPDSVAPSSSRGWHKRSGRILERIALTVIVGLATVLRVANLAALGEANHYYTAAVAAMLQSWHNFFFVAAEPGGSVTVDKPPVGFWIQAISARILGVNTWGVLLPQIVAGVLSVIVLCYLIRRWFGPVAGLLAGLALATTPIVLATDRNNTIDSTLILTLLLAAWAFIRATETVRLRFLVLGAILVGIGFNIKMLQAYLPLPAFLALYFFGAKEHLPRKIGKLALAAGLILVVSLSWASVVDLTPADQRPYVGSSSDNSELSLILGYNGVERLVGMGRQGGLLARVFGGNQAGGPPGGPDRPVGADGTRTFEGGPVPQGQIDGSQFQPPAGFQAQGGPIGGNGFQAPMDFQPPQGQGGSGGPPPQGMPGSPGGGGPFGTGNPSALRLFITPLSKEVSWLLPFGLVSLALLALRSRLRWPITVEHQAVVLWGGWLLTGGIFFSIAGFFHQYYLSMLAAPLAALVGIGVAGLWQLRGVHPWIASGLMLIATVGTVAFQITTAAAYVGTPSWITVVIMLTVAGALLSLPLARHRKSLDAPAGYACLVAALVLTPGIWSALTMVNSSENQSLPAAYEGRSSGPVNMGHSQVDAELLAFLEQGTPGMKYLIAVPSAMQGADYVLATGRGVLYLGGFNGQDRVETSASLSRLVNSKELRYIYLDGGGGGFGGPGASSSDVSTWVSSQCKPVQGFDTTTQNMGAPDGTMPTTTGGRGAFGGGGPGGMRVSLYDCGKG